MAIEVRNLLKTYGTQRAVDNISFSVKEGEILGFLGPNGAGKSTTMKLITGFFSPDSGSITVNGTDVVKDPLAVKKKIGYLPESNALYYDMYVREYLIFISSVHGTDKKRIEEVISMTGLQKESGKTIGQLSKGYKQRVGLAAALIHDPAVLILDEPTSGLDPNQIIEIRNVIKEQGRNKLVMFSSHILQEVEAICDRVIIINKGKIVADDRLQNLQKHKGPDRLVVAFRQALEPEWLRRIEGVLEVTKLDAQTWSLSVNNAEAVQKRILQLSLDQNLNIVSLQSEDQSLEEVFRSLTSN